MALTSAQVFWGDHSDWDAEHHHRGQHDLASGGRHLRHHRSEDGPHVHQVQPVSSESACVEPEVRFYINWTRLVFTCMLPVIFLILLNYKIFRGIRFSKLLLRSIFIMRCHFFCILRVLEVFEDFHHDMVVFFNSEHERASSAIILLPSALCFHFPRRWYVEKIALRA